MVFHASAHACQRASRKPRSGAVASVVKVLGALRKELNIATNVERVEASDDLPQVVRPREGCSPAIGSEGWHTSYQSAVFLRRQGANFDRIRECA